MKPYFVEVNETPEAAPAPVAPAPETEAPVHMAVFNPPAFPFRACAYRIHFKNGLSGEYDGQALATNFPFDPREVHRVEEAE